MTYLYHLVPASAWTECKACSSPYFPPTYRHDGFIHLTKEAELLLPVANHFYKNDPGTYLVLKLDSTKLKAEVKFEPAAPVGDKQTTNFADKTEGDKTEEQLFPHLYGTIDFDAVESELAVHRATDGAFLSIEGL